MPDMLNMTGFPFRADPAARSTGFDFIAHFQALGNDPGRKTCSGTFAANEKHGLTTVFPKNLVHHGDKEVT